MTSSRTWDLPPSWQVAADLVPLQNLKTTHDGSAVNQNES
jgi:hypothetical protein